MKDQDFTTSFEVRQSPMEVFRAVNQVNAWWSEEVVGITDRLEGEFLYHYKTVHQCRIRIVEFVPGQKVVWEVLDNYFDFIGDQREWKGSRISFDISAVEDATRLVFHHYGLVPSNECYPVCHEAWTRYILTSLKALIETGKGTPNGREGGFNERLIEKHGLLVAEHKVDNL